MVSAMNMLMTLVLNILPLPQMKHSIIFFYWFNLIIGL